MTNMLRALMEKKNSIQKQVVYVSREMETLRKNSKEMLELKTQKKMKHAFNGLIGRPACQVKNQ